MFNVRVSSLVLALGLLGAASAGPAFSQNDSQQSQSSPIVGRWEMQMQMQDGATLHQFDEYGAPLSCPRPT